MEIKLHTSKIIKNVKLNNIKNFPTSVLSDAMNKKGFMAPEIKPISKKTKLLGYALTVTLPKNDNLALHYALKIANKGDVLVVNAKFSENNAPWGDIMSKAAIKKGLAGIIIDGFVRDADELMNSTLPIFCKGASPGGVYKNGGGIINSKIKCGKLTVAPGDIVVGDEQGIVVVPQKIFDKVTAKAKEIIKTEKMWESKINKGIDTLKTLNLKCNIKKIK